MIHLKFKQHVRYNLQHHDDCYDITNHPFKNNLLTNVLIYPKIDFTDVSQIHFGIEKIVVKKILY